MGFIVGGIVVLVVGLIALNVWLERKRTRDLEALAAQLHLTFRAELEIAFGVFRLFTGGEA